MCGINPGRIRTLIVTLSAMMAGMGGVVQGLFSSLGTEMGNELTSFALIVAVVGGVRSINGTLSAGVLLGIVNAFASYFVGAYLTLIILLGTAVFTILLRPEGLFASVHEHKPIPRRICDAARCGRGAGAGAAGLGGSAHY